MLVPLVLTIRPLPQVASSPVSDRPRVAAPGDSPWRKSVATALGTWPSFVTQFALPAGTTATTLAALTDTGQWPVAPIALFAGFSAWLVRPRNVRWRLISPGGTPPETEDETGAEFWPGRACDVQTAAPAPLVLAPHTTPVPPSWVAPIEGADLVARARLVALTFAFPEPGPERSDLSAGPSAWPLHMVCHPTRFTLTLQHAALGYRLVFCNRGAAALGPLIIRADLVSAANLAEENSRIAQSRPVEFAVDALPLCHYLDSMPAGESVELTGEQRLSLAGIAAMRLGSAELLVPLIRLCAESAGPSQPALSVSACFAVGLPPLSPGGGIQPFRLDSGPGIWRKLTARRVILADLS